MPRPLSIDLRERLARAVAEGPVRALGARLGVSASSVSNISRLWGEIGSVVPKSVGNARRSHMIGGHGDRILDLIGESPDLTLEEIQAALARDGIEFGRVSI
jgi:transposase